MKRITALALLSALIISALPLSALADEPAYPEPPAISSFEELESCLVAYAPQLYDYYLATETEGEWAPRFTSDQRNYPWVRSLAEDQVRSLDEKGEWAARPSHDAANAANPGTKSIVHATPAWSEEAFDAAGDRKWSTLCEIIAHYVVWEMQPAIIGLDRLSWIDGRPLRYSFAVAMTEKEHALEEDPSLVSRLVVVGIQAWTVKPEGAGFTDTPANHVFTSDIRRLAESGITRGCNPPANTRFCPDDVVTRGQMAAFLVRALDLKPGKSTFADTKGHVFAADIAALADAGITRGCGPNRFCPDQPVTRGQMAAFLVRALNLPAGKSVFSDMEGHVFAADAAALAQAGITRGCNPPRNDRFCPDEPVTRGQMAAFLVRAGLAD